MKFEYVNKGRRVLCDIMEEVNKDLAEKGLEFVDMGDDELDFAVFLLSPPRLKWEFDGEGSWFVGGTKHPRYVIGVQADGWFRVQSGSVGSSISTLPLAKAWCQALEDKLLAEQEGKSDD